MLAAFKESSQIMTVQYSRAPRSPHPRTPLHFPDFFDFSRVGSWSDLMIQQHAASCDKTPHSDAR